MRGLSLLTMSGISRYGFWNRPESGPCGAKLLRSRMGGGRWNPQSAIPIYQYQCVSFISEDVEEEELIRCSVVMVDPVNPY